MLSAELLFADFLEVLLSSQEPPGGVFVSLEKSKGRLVKQGGSQELAEAVGVLARAGTRAAWRVAQKIPFLARGEIYPLL